MELAQPIDSKGSYFEAHKKKLKFDSNLLFYVLFLIWPIAQFCVFYIYVNFNSILLVFKSWAPEQGKFVFTGVDSSFVAVWKDIQSMPKLYGNAILHSLASWAASLIFGTFFAAVFSYYIYMRRWGGKTFKFLLFLPSVIPSMLLSAIFTFFCNDAVRYTVYHVLEANYGGAGPVRIQVPQLLDPNNASFYWMIIVFNIITGFGSQVLLYSGSMSQINPSLIEAAKLDGASPFKTFFHVALPQVMPTIGTFLISSVATFFTSQANLWNFAQARLGNNTVYSLQMNLGYYMFWLVNGGTTAQNYTNYPKAAALGLVCTAFAIPLTMLVRKFVKRFER